MWRIAPLPSVLLTVQVAPAVFNRSRFAAPLVAMAATSTAGPSASVIEDRQPMKTTSKNKRVTIGLPVAGHFEGDSDRSLSRRKKLSTARAAPGARAAAREK